MAKRGVKKRGSRAIVVGHLEKVGRGIFDTYQKQITDIIRGHRGVYALYRRNTLYYVGLARNLKRRIKQHLKDKHGSSWTHFSLYVFKSDSHIQELEALVLRIAYPVGNRQRGKLKGSADLRPNLKRAVKKEQNEEIEKLFKKYKGAIKKKKGVGKAKMKGAKAKAVKAGVERALKGVFPGGKVIYGEYKGRQYKAWVCRNGRIKYDGRMYESPSGAAKAIVERRTVNGWSFWKYKDGGGGFRALGDLRK